MGGCWSFILKPTDEVRTYLQCWSVKTTINRAYEEAKVDINDPNMFGRLVKP